MSNHVKTVIGNVLVDSKQNVSCGECQASCQSACKTSCTVGNQKCLQNADKQK